MDKMKFILKKSRDGAIQGVKKLYQSYCKNQLRTKQNQQNLQQFNNINKKNWIQLKQLDDIFKFNQKRSEVIEKFIVEIPKLNYEKKPRHKDHIIIMGSISAGKSSILNKLLNKELEFGVGETTLSVDKIYSNNKVEVSDSPGINKDYDIFDVEVLKELLEMDIFIVCFQNCLSQVYEITRVLHAISEKWRQKLYLVRTQCDRFSSSDSLTLEQQIQIDKKYVKDRFDRNIEILATSAKSNMKFKDNQRLQDILTGGQSLEFLGTQMRKLKFEGGKKLYQWYYKNQLRTKQNQQNLQQFNNINKKNWDQLKQLDDIFKFNQKRSEVIEKFIVEIPKLNYEKKPRHKDHIIIMGSISAGKSSILNKLLNKELEFGVGETTLSVDKIYSNNKVEVSDSPGINKDYDIFGVEVLKELLEMDIFIVCFQNCLSQVYEITRVLHAISEKWRQKLYLVRTQCDRFSSSDSLTLEQQIQIDKKYVKDRFDRNIEILATSAKSNMKFKDNQRLQDILTGNHQKRIQQNFQELK